MIKTENIQKLLIEIDNNVVVSGNYCFPGCKYIDGLHYLTNVSKCELFQEEIKIAIDDNKFNRCKKCLTYIEE